MAQKPEDVDNKRQSASFSSGLRFSVFNRLNIAGNRGRIHPAVIVVAVLIIVFLLLVILGNILIENQIKTAVEKNISGTIEYDSMKLGLRELSYRNFRIKTSDGETPVIIERLVISYDPMKVLQRPFGIRAATAIDVYRPVADIYVGKDGKWNISRLLPAKPTIQMGNIVAPLRIHEGTLRFRDETTPEVFRQTAAPVNATILIKGDEGYTVESLDIPLENQSHLRGKGDVKVTADGLTLNRVHITIDNADIVTWGNYLLRQETVKFSRGTADIVVDASGTGVPLDKPFAEILQQLDYRASANVSCVSIKFNFLPDTVQNLTGNVLLMKQVVQFRQMNGSYRGTPVRISGSIVGFEKPLLNLNVYAPAVPLEKMRNQPFISSLPVPVAGLVKLNLTVKGFIDSPIINGSLEFDKIRAADEVFRNGDISYRYFSNTTTVEIRRIRWVDGSFSGSGYINTEEKTPHFIANLHGENANVSRLARRLFPTFVVEARSDFDIKVIGTLKDPLLFGQTDFADATYRNFSVQTGSGNFIYYNNALSLFGVSLQTPGGYLYSPRAFFDLRRNYMNLSVMGSNFLMPTALIPALSGVNARADFVAAVSGTLSAPFAAGRFANADVVYQGQHISNARGDFVYSGNTVFLGDTSVNYLGSQVHLNGWYQSGPQPKGAFAFSIPSLRLSSLKPLVPALGETRSQQSAAIDGALTINNNLYKYTFTGMGSLGEFASFGNVRPVGSTFYVKSALLGWDVDFNDFMTPASYQHFQPGIGDIQVLSKGTLNHLTNEYIVTTPGGQVLGLPFNFSRGTIVYTPPNLRLRDTFVLGVSEASPIQERLEALEKLYRIETYWGADIYKDQYYSSLLARMYYFPYILQRYTFKTNNWNVSVLGPVTFRECNPLQGCYKAVLGLPEIWGIEDYYELERIGHGNFPLQVTYEPREDIAERPNETNVYNLSANGTINLNSGRLNLDVASTGIELGLVGRRIELETLGIDTSQIRTYTENRDLRGTAQLMGHVGGTYNSPTFSGNVEIPNGSAGGNAFSLATNLSLSAQGANIRDARLRQDSSEYTAQGSVSFKSALPFNVILGAQDGKLAQILSLTPWNDLPLRGTVNGTLNARGDLNNIRFDTAMSIKDAEFYGQPISVLDVVVRSDRNTVTLERLRACIDGGTISGSGKMQNDNLDFRVAAAEFPMSSIQALRSNFPDVTGVSDFSINITGSRMAPDISFDLSTRDFCIQSKCFDRLTGSATWHERRLNIKEITLAEAESYWNLAGYVEFPGGDIPFTREAWMNPETAPVFNLESNINAIEIEDLLTIANSELHDDLSGTLNGKIIISGTFPRPNLHLDITASDGNIGTVPYSRIELLADRSQKVRWDVERFSFTSPEAAAFVSGFFDPRTDQLEARTAINNVPIAIAWPFQPTIRGVNGNIFATASISGNPDVPDLNADVHVRNFSYGYVTFDDFGGQVTAQKGVVSFNDLALRRGRHQIVFQGNIPLAIQNDRLVNTAPLEITGRLDDQSLDILGIFFPVVQSTTGNISGLLKVTGLYPDLNIEGSTRVRNGSVKLTLLENPITNLAADITFNGKQLTIETLKGMLEPGTFTVEGFARLDEETFKIEDMHFILKGCNLTVLMPGLIRGKVDTKITLTGSQDRPFVGVTEASEGRDFLTIYSATLSLPEGQMRNFSQLFSGTPAEQAGAPAATTGAAKETDSMSTIRRGLQGDEDEEPARTRLRDRNNRAAVSTTPPATGTPANPSLLPSFQLPEIQNFILTLGEDVWLDFSGLFIQSQGSLLVGRIQGQSLRLFGELDFSRGSLKLPFLARPLRITNGIAYFNGGDPVTDAQGNIVDYVLNPSFEFEGQTYASGYEIYMTYEGKLDELREAFLPSGTSSIRSDLTFYSVPPLSREAIVRLLISETFLGGLITPGTGAQGQQPTPTIENVALSAVTNYLQEILLSEFTRSIGRALAFSEFYFQYTPIGGVTMTVSRALDARERFFLTYTRIKGPQQPILEFWGLEYKYRSGMRIRTELVQSSVVVSLRGQIEFDTMGEFFDEFWRAITFQGSRNARQPGRRNGAQPGGQPLVPDIQPTVCPTP